jgi:hypothetical protein
VICGICSYPLCIASSEFIHQTSCHSVALGVPWGVAGYSAMEVALRSASGGDRCDVGGLAVALSGPMKHNSAYSYT